MLLPAILKAVIHLILSRVVDTFVDNKIVSLVSLVYAMGGAGANVTATASATGVGNRWR